MIRGLFLQRRPGTRADWYARYSAGRRQRRHIRRHWDVLRRRGWDDERIEAAQPYFGGSHIRLPAYDRYAPGAAMNRCRYAIQFRRDYGFYPRGIPC